MFGSYYPRGYFCYFCFFCLSNRFVIQWPYIGKDLNSHFTHIYMFALYFISLFPEEVIYGSKCKNLIYAADNCNISKS